MSDAIELFDLLLPAGAQLIGPFLQVRQFLLQRRQPLLGGWIFLSAQALALDLQLGHPPHHLVQLYRHARGFHADARRGFVHQVDRLVREEAI